MIHKIVHRCGCTNEVQAGYVRNWRWCGTAKCRFKKRASQANRVAS